MILFHDVGKRYPCGHEALRNVSFHLPADKLAFLTGHSGAGKTTLLKLVACVEQCTHGQIMVDGHNIGQLRKGQIPYLSCTCRQESS
jgi:cell division transport system ATP-binding protein